MKSPFNGKGKKSDYAQLVYKLLVSEKDTYISYVDVLAAYNNKPLSYYVNHTGSDGELKKAFPEVIAAIQEVYPNSIVKEKRGNRVVYKYVGDDRDPLNFFENTLSIYVDFMKNSAGMFPVGWLSSFFEDTHLLYLVQNGKNDDAIVQTSMTQELTNIELLPDLCRYISKKKVLKLKYQPYGEEAEEMIFHPQVLKEYNGRWFLLGHASTSPFEAHNLAIDRIVKDSIQTTKDTYISAPDGFYSTYFKERVGVSQPKKANGCRTIVIRTLSAYMHGLIDSKKLHSTQKEILSFNENGQGYGEFEFCLEPNVEFRGKLMTFGRQIEVVKPKFLRKQIAWEVKEMAKRYFEDNKNFDDSFNVEYGK